MVKEGRVDLWEVHNDEAREIRRYFYNGKHKSLFRCSDWW